MQILHTYHLVGPKKVVSESLLVEDHVSNPIISSYKVFFCQYFCIIPTISVLNRIDRNSNFKIKKSSLQSFTSLLGIKKYAALGYVNDWISPLRRGYKMVEPHKKGLSAVLLQNNCPHFSVFPRNKREQDTTR